MGIKDQGPQRNRDDEVRSTPSYLVLALSMLASFGVILLLVAKINERRELGVALEDHISALSPIASIRPSPGDKLLTAKTKAAVSPIPGGY